MKRPNRPFVVGRRTRKGTTVVLLRGAVERAKPAQPMRAAQPMRGPWTVRAVVTPAPAA